MAIGFCWVKYYIIVLMMKPLSVLLTLGIVKEMMPCFLASSPGSSIFFNARENRGGEVSTAFLGAA